MEPRHIPDRVVRRKDADHRLRVIPLQQERRQRAGRSRIPRLWLTQNPLPRNSRQLLRDDVAEQVIRDHPHIVILHHIVEPRHRLLNHGVMPIELQNLFSPCPPAARPESRSASARQHERGKRVARLRLP